MYKAQRVVWGFKLVVLGEGSDRKGTIKLTGGIYTRIIGYLIDY
jgi:hypothetical protein